jgi:hypothetical protein
METLRQQLADRVAAITLAAGQQQLREVDKLQAKFEEAFKGNIPDAVKEGLQIIRAAAEEAVEIGAAEELAQGFRDRIASGLREITILSQEFTDEEERRAFVLEQQTRLFEIELFTAEKRLDAAEAGTKEEEKLKDVIAEIVKLLQKARGEQEAMADEAGRDAKERLRDLQSTLQLINQSVNGALELANAFGLVNDETADTIRNLEQIGAGIATLAVSIPSGNIPGIVSGGLGVAGGLAGLLSGHETPEAAAQKRILEENTKALEDLSWNIHELAGSFQVAGADFARALQFLRGFDRTEFFRQDKFIANLRAAGLSLKELEEIAEEFGITLMHEGHILVPALVDLLNQLEAAKDAFIGFPDTIEGTLSRLQTEFELFDVTDPVEQIQRIAGELAALTKVGEGVPALQKLFGLDFTTAEGRAQAEEIIRTLFQQLAAGLITPAQLGAATFEEALEILKQMEGLLDDIDEGTVETEGTTQDVRRSVQVTEVQANAILSRMDTGLFLSRERNALLESMLLAMGGSITPVAAPAAAGITNNSVEVNFQNVEIIVNAENGQEMADVFIEEVDRRIGERLLIQRRLMGLN